MATAQSRKRTVTRTNQILFGTSAAAGAGVAGLALSDRHRRKTVDRMNEEVGAAHSNANAQHKRLSSLIEAAHPKVRDSQQVLDDYRAGPMKAMLRRGRHLHIVKSDVDKAFHKELLTSRAGLKLAYHLYPEEIKRGFAIGVPVAAAATGGEMARHRDDPRRPQSSAVIGGGVAGNIGYQATGFAAMRRGRHQQAAGAAMHNGLNSAQQRDVWNSHRAAHGVKPGTSMSHIPYRTRTKLFQEFPRQLPGARSKRFAANYALGTKRGLALSGAMTGLGALAAGEASHYGSSRRKGNAVGKSMYVRDRSVSPVKVLEAGLGAGLATWGLSRSPMIGRALARGMKQATGKDNRAAMEAIQLAQSAYGAAARVSGRGERAVRQIRRVDQAVSAVPAAMRPAVAATAGMLLLGSSHGMRTESYHPVNIRIRTGYQGGR